MEAVLAKSARCDGGGDRRHDAADAVGGMRPHMWATLGVELLVREEDAQAARNVWILPAMPARPR